MAQISDESILELQKTLYQKLWRRASQMKRR